MLFNLKYLNAIDYFGIRMYLPKHIKYLATDSDGSIHGYTLKPKPDSLAGHFRVSDRAELEDYTHGLVYIIRLEILQGNWADSCISVEQLLWRNKQQQHTPI